MFRPAYVSALGRKNRPGRPLHKETRRRIIDCYLTGEGPTAISTAARATPGAVYCIIRHHETSVPVRRSVKAFRRRSRIYGIVQTSET